MIKKFGLIFFRFKNWIKIGSIGVDRKNLMGAGGGGEAFLARPLISGKTKINFQQ